MKKSNDYTPLTPQEKQLIQFLEMIRDVNLRNFNNKLPEQYKYAGQADYLLQHGKFYRAQELTPEERKYVEHKIKHLGFVPKERRCWYNSQMLALNSVAGDDGLEIKYHEGQADPKLIATEHGFNTINEKVIDITWKHRKGEREGKWILGDVPEDWCYFGVELDKDLVYEQQREAGMANSVLEQNRELYKKKREPKFESGGEVNEREINTHNISDNQYKEPFGVYYHYNGFLAYNSEQF